MARLHDLAPELLRLIVQDVDDPEDLIALIKGSSRCYRAFKISPEKSLAIILTKSIGTDALPHALALAHFSANSNAGGGTSGTTDSNPTPTPIDLAALKFPDDVAALMTMWRFHKILTVFVDGYVSSAMEAIKEWNEDIRNYVSRDSDDAFARVFGYLSSNEDEEADLRLDGPPQEWIWPNLAASERARFERAFYRLELHSRINPSVPNKRFWDYYPDESVDKTCLKKYNFFMRTWQPWESAELLCAHGYLTRIIRHMIRELNYALFEAVVETPGARFPSDVEARSEPDKSATTDEDRMDFEKLELYSMGYYSKELMIYGRDTRTSYVATTGLLLVSQLLLAEMPERKVLLQVNRPYHHHRNFKQEINYRSSLPDSSPAGLGRIPIWKERAISPEDEGILPDQDGVLSGTYGFRKFPAPTRMLGVPDPSTDPLQVMAAMFWDAERIRIPCVEVALGRGWRFPRSYRLERDEAAAGRSAEQLLEGVTVPRVEFERIQREFGIVSNQDAQS